MPQRSTKAKEKRSSRTPFRRKKKTAYQKSVENFWEKHWEIIIAAIAGLLVGMFIVPQFFR